MDQIKRITDEEFRDLASKLNFDIAKLTKDYFVTLLLYLTKDVDGICFKGGTAIQKILLDHSRLSEDVDFTLTRDVSEVKKEIKAVIMGSKLFEGVTEDKTLEGFARVVVHYVDFSDQKDKVFIDLSERTKPLLQTEEHEIKHFYEPNIPRFSVKTLAVKEIVAEKVRATMTRNKPRDHFDVYKLIEAKVPIDLELTRKKCKQAGIEFSVVKMFNKAKTLKNRWDKDTIALLDKPISFQEVIQFLARHFKLKEEKEAIRKSSNEKE